jgi:hypothetical protein
MLAVSETGTVGKAVAQTHEGPPAASAALALAVKSAANPPSP